MNERVFGLWVPGRVLETSQVMAVRVVILPKGTVKTEDVLEEDVVRPVPAGSMPHPHRRAQ
jgi:hypothetical protein